MVLRTNILLATAKRIPLIKFRKGGPSVTSTSSAVSSTASSQGASSMQGVSSGARASNVGDAIEDWQLPARYRRKTIDSTEMEYINRGGPA